MVKLISPIWSNLKQKDKIVLREKCYNDLILTTICSMFEYETEDKELTKALDLRLEEILRLYGKVAFFMDGDILKFGKCHFVNGANGVNWYGASDGVTITTLDGTIYERTNGVDCVVMFNNNLGLAELNIFRFVEQLAQVDLSQVDLLINARSHPIIVAPNDKVKDIIVNAIKSSNDGQPITIANNSKIVNGAIAGVDSNIEVVTVTDPQTATLFQYYSHYHLDLMSRFYGLIGLSTFNTGKMAQTNDLEVSGSLASTMVIPINNFNCRTKAVKEINDLFGVNIDVKFGDCWKNQLSMIQGIEKEDKYDVEVDEVDTNGDGIVNENDVVKDAENDGKEELDS